MLNFFKGLQAYAAKDLPQDAIESNRNCGTTLRCSEHFNFKFKSLVFLLMITVTSLLAVNTAYSRCGDEDCPDVPWYPTNNFGFANNIDYLVDTIITNTGCKIAVFYKVKHCIDGALLIRIHWTSVLIPQTGDCSLVLNAFSNYTGWVNQAKDIYLQLSILLFSRLPPYMYTCPTQQKKILYSVGVCAKFCTYLEGDFDCGVIYTSHDECAPCFIEVPCCKTTRLFCRKPDGDIDYTETVDSPPSYICNGCQQRDCYILPYTDLLYSSPCIPYCGE